MGHVEEDVGGQTHLGARLTVRASVFAERLPQLRSLDKVDGLPLEISHPDTGDGRSYLRALVEVNSIYYDWITLVRPLNLSS